MKDKRVNLMKKTDISGLSNHFIFDYLLFMLA